MTNRILKILANRWFILIPLMAITFSTFTGCRKKKAPPPPAPTITRDTKPKQPTWDVIDIQPIDQVVLQNAVLMDCSRGQMEAIVDFLNAFTSGNTDLLRPMLDSLSQRVLDELVASDAWEEQTMSIRQVDLIQCTNMLGSVRFGFSISMMDGRIDELWWTAKPRGDVFVFSAYAELPEPNPVEEEAEEEEETASSNDRSQRKRKGASPDRFQPNDPRKRVPPSGPG